MIDLIISLITKYYLLNNKQNVFKSSFLTNCVKKLNVKVYFFLSLLKTHFLTNKL